MRVPKMTSQRPGSWNVARRQLAKRLTTKHNKTLIHLSIRTAAGDCVMSYEGFLTGGMTNKYRIKVYTRTYFGIGIYLPIHLEFFPSWLAVGSLVLSFAVRRLSYKADNKYRNTVSVFRCRYFTEKYR